MPTEFWIVMALLAVVAVASIRLGFVWGTRVANDFWAEKMQESCKNEFMANYFNMFVTKFEERVEDTSNKIAAEKITEYIETLPEEQQKWFLGMEIEDDNKE